MVSETDYAWAAGFFDGEGHTGYISGIRYRADRRSKEATYHYLEIAISQASKDGVPEVLVKFQSIVGGSIFGPYEARTRITPLYKWCARNNAARRILKQLWPYLGTVKRKQAINTNQLLIVGKLVGETL